MREKKWLLLVLYGILLAHAVSGALKTRPKFKIATTSTTTTTTEEPHVEENENGDEPTTVASAEGNGTTGHTLTGIPQIDYIWDPNLPRELNGYNLSDYPFYNSIPEDIDFKCDGLHDGFYASVPHKCQVYHHCLFGTRYDFLCANFTAFDQKTFICHFVSEVDCANSKKYWHRNDALYKATTTSTTSTSTTTTPAPVTAASGRSAPRDVPRRRRPPLRRRPVYDYYDEEYYDDEYSRPRGYDRREYDEYDDRKYRRDRDRDFRDRDRDFRDRDPPPRARDPPVREDRDRETFRDRYPTRNNRRDPPRARDPLEDDVRGRGRDPDPATRSRETDDSEVDDRRVDSRVRDTDDRRYQDKRFRDEYDDKDPAPAAATGNTEGLVKPAAPSTSVYARPRAPPKIRRPVPLSEQDKYAYKAPAAQSTEDPRRRPVDTAEDDYYEDELEEIRPVRRPMRRRPVGTFWDRDRDFYDVRDRERERDRPFRTRYRDEEDDIRPRKHPDRGRDRYYDRDRDRAVERGRDRALDRTKDRTPDRTPDRSHDRIPDRTQDRTVDRDRGRTQDSDRQERPYLARPLDRDRDVDRPRSSSRSKDPETTDAPKRPSIYDRTTERATTSTSTTTTTTTCLPEDLTRHIEAEKEPVPERGERLTPQVRQRLINSQNAERAQVDEPESPRNSEKHRYPVHYHDRDQEDRHEQSHQQAISSEEYSSEYYDEPEDPPSPPPRTAVRIVKRPFLPSRGGNPNPRGLLPVGAKAGSGRRDEERATERTAAHEDHKGYYVEEDSREDHRGSSQERGKSDEKQTYDAYKVIQSQDLQQKHRVSDDYDSTLARPALRRPIDRSRDDQSSIRPVEEHDRSLESHSSEQKWSDDYSSKTNDNVPTSSPSPNRGKIRHPTEPANSYTSPYKSEEQESATGPGNLRVKQRINEVTHRLQDIPESEYDVTLNDALTPTLNQESNLPSGFVLPLHRQLGRDAVLQPSENNYKLSRPVSQQQQQSQQQHQQQQKPFIASPQFLPHGVNTNERSRTVYYRTPETIQISGPQYRQQRGPWHEYTGY